MITEGDVAGKGDKVDIQLSKVSKSFEGKQVLHKLDITFQEGRINCLMGASGIGKTTIINLLMGLIKPDTGTISGVRDKRIAAVFQEDRLIEHWSVLKNIRLVSDKKITDQRIEEELARVGLDNISGQQVNSLSGGMRRRVALIRAILAEGDLLILDEPMKGLDELLKVKVMEYFKEKAKGKTVIWVTHDKEEVDLLEANLINLS